MAAAFIPYTAWPIYLAIFSVICLVYTVIRRRYFHRLAKIPGPFLWAVSGLPILYHQHFKEGNLIHALMKLHSRYGPVIRISPTEVHLSEPNNYEKIYTIGSKFLKDPGYYSPIDIALKTPIILTVIDHDVHKIRRAALNSFFSRRSVLGLEDIVWTKARKMCDLIQSMFDRSGAGIAFDLNRAVRALTVDIITEYAYGRCWNQLDKEDFGTAYQAAIRAIQTVFIWFQTFPFILPIFDLFPEWLRGALFESLKRWDESMVNVRDAVTTVRKEIALEIKPKRRTIFHALMDPETEAEATGRHQEPLSDDLVFAEAVVLTGAGTETTGATTERAIFEVLSNPTVYKALTMELREAFPNPSAMRLTELEKLPCLSGVVKEGMRLNPGVPGHLPRVVPHGGAVFNGMFIPQGSVVSMSAWILHHNKDLFPEPGKFDPDRWNPMHSSEDVVRARERALVPFSRGTRACIGQNLAVCEMYCTIAALFHRFNNLAIEPSFRREDLDMVELLIGYHPKKAQRFKIVRTGIV